MNHKKDLTGSSFDSLLQEDGLLDEVEAVAVKRVLAWKLRQAMKAQRVSKLAMARRLRTSRSQLDRLLDPANTAVSLATIARAAAALGQHLTIDLDHRTNYRRGRGPAVPTRRRRAAAQSQ